MKRLMFFLFFFLTNLCAVFAQDDALYVFRNDGGFNAFLRAEIDSIAFSHFDKDSIYHNDWQMQVVYTKTGVCKIPLASIDSVSLTAPEAEVNSDVFQLTAAHDCFLSGCDTVQFTLALSTPAYMRPSKGNVVVSACDCSSFPDGIMARVVSKEQDDDGFHYVCRQVSIDEVYDRLVAIGSVYCEDTLSEHDVARSVGVASDSKLWDVNWRQTLEKDGAAADMDVGGVAHMTVAINIQPGKPLYFRMDLHHDLKSSFAFKASKSADNYCERRLKRLRLGKIRIPACPLLYIIPKFDISAYVAVGGKADVDFSAHYNRTDKVSFIYQNKVWSVSHTPADDAGVDVASLSMTGYAEAGLKPNLLFSFCGSATGIGMEYSIGLRETANFSLDGVALFDEGAYQALKDSYVRTTLPQKLRIYAQVGLFGDGVRPFDKSFSYEPQVGSDRYLLPLFTKPVYTQGSSADRAVLNTAISRDLLFPLEVGMVLYEGNKKLTSKFSAQKYRILSEWLQNGMRIDFDNIQPGKRYTAYPAVRIFGRELRAVPPVDFPDYFYCHNLHHPHAVDLGLPSGLKWCCANVGAANPEDYGDYYAWGETEAKSYYRWTTYKWAKGSAVIALTKYCTNSRHGTVDNLTTLELSDDAAHGRMGGAWRMPTRTELEELRNNCTWTRTAMNDVEGFMVMGKNGNSIFLPAAGFHDESNFGGVGSDGYYWLSSLYTNYPYSAEMIKFSSNRVYWGSYGSRYYGRSVRAVCP